MTAKPAPPAAPAPSVAPRASPPAPTGPALASRRFQMRGAPVAFGADLYHRLMRAPLWRLLAQLFGVWLLINAVFTALYVAGGDCYNAQPEHPLLSAFSFSVQTLSSIGYGAQHPTTAWAHWIANVEAFVGMVSSAMGAGLMFARFARPSARVAFSNRLVIHRRDGVPTLLLRTANLRGNQIVEAQASLHALCDHVSAEGHKARRLIELPLVRGRSPVFALSWLIQHEINEKSPLHGLSEEELRAKVASFIVSITGIDDIFHQTVHAQQFYDIGQVAWNESFVDMVTPTEDGGMIVHHDMLHLRKPGPADPPLLRLVPLRSGPSLDKAAPAPAQRPEGPA